MWPIGITRLPKEFITHQGLRTPGLDRPLKSFLALLIYSYDKLIQEYLMGFVTLLSFKEASSSVACLLLAELDMVTVTRFCP